MRRTGSLWSIAFASALLAACTQQQAPSPSVSAEEFQALSARVRYLEDMTAIQKLQASYVHSLFTQRYEHIPALFARNTRDVPGFFILHMAVNPCIEIGADGRSAKSHWLSPGAANSPGGSSWIFEPYYVGYVKENGEWKILHSNLAPLFRNPYQYSWGDAPNHGTVNVSGMLGLEPDAPSTLYKPFNEVKGETDIFRHHPDLPQPY